MLFGGLLALLTSCTPIARPTSSLRVASRLPQSQRWFSAENVQLKASGAEPVRLLALEGASAGDRVHAVVEVPAERCLVAMGRSGDGVADLDLLAYSEDGAVLGRDEDADATPNVIVCPPHPAHIYLMGRVATGQGLVALGAELVDVARVKQIAQQFARLPQAASSASSEETGLWPDLSALSERLSHVIGGDWRLVARQILSVDARLDTVQSYVVPPGECASLLVVGETRLSSLDVSLEDGAGRELGELQRFEDHPLALLCSSTQESASLLLRPRVGAGVVSVLVGSRSLTGLAPGLAAKPISLGAPQTLATLSDVLKLPGVKPQRLDTRSDEPLNSGEIQRHALPSPVTCGLLEVLVGAPGAGLHTVLRDADSQVLAESWGGQRTTLLDCRVGRGSAELSLSRGSAPVLPRWWPLARVAPVLRQAPQAAARLYSAYQHHPEPLKRLLDARIYSAGSDEGKSTRLPLTLEPGACVSATFAGSGAQGWLTLSVSQGEAKVLQKVESTLPDPVEWTYCAPETSAESLEIQTQSSAGTRALLAINYQSAPPHAPPHNLTSLTKP